MTFAVSGITPNVSLLEYANSVMTYSCPYCAKGFEKGFLHFLFHFRFDTLTATGDGYNKIFRKWKTLNNKDKQVVRTFSYTMLSTSPLLFRDIYKFFPDRGIMNLYNNCWANAVLQVICGSAVSHYLPRVNECPTPLWECLMKINKQLQINPTDTSDTARSSLPVTNEIRTLISMVYKRDQKEESVQDDAADFLHLILKDLLEHSLPNTCNFECKTIHISGCSICKKVVSSISSNVCLLLPLTQCLGENISIQSLLWEWCIANETQNTVNCFCGSEADIWHRSFFLTIPKVLVLLTDRVYENGRKNESLIFVDTTLNMGILLACKVCDKNLDYTLAAVVNHHGSTVATGHYDTCIFNIANEAVKCNDANLHQSAGDRVLKSDRLRRSTRLLFYIIDNDKGGHESQEAMNSIEKVWFGLETVKSSLLQIEDLGKLIGKQKLSGDIIHCFMRGIIEDEINQGRGVYALSNYLVPDVQERKRTSFFLNEVVKNSEKLLSAEILLIPYHQSHGITGVS